MSRLIIFALLPLIVFSLDNGVGLTPPMGWNPHNFVNGDFNESLTMESAQALINSGLSQLGYVYVNLDDGWQNFTRAANGCLTANPQKFPDGIPYLVDYVHNLGLKFGIYSGAGAMTYKGLPGSLGHEDTDADTFASWEVDYLKYDYFKDNWTVPVPTRDARMEAALNQTGRHIYYSNSGGGIDLPWLWGPPMLNSWRIALDIQNNWTSIPRIAKSETLAYAFSKIGAWNDADMLEVGNGVLTDIEAQTHFALWAFWKSPLLIGCDVRNMSNATYTILSNTEIIAINQDPLGKQADRIWYSLDGNQEIWGSEQSTGYAFIMVNYDESPANVTAEFTDLHVTGPLYARDLIAHQNLGQIDSEFTATIVPHGCVTILLTNATYIPTIKS
jgi:alpha-galactosidase